MNYQAFGIATNTLIKSGIIAYPTEYCYGLGCDPMNRNAVQRVLEIKKRRWSQGLIIIASDLRQLVGLIDLSKKDILKEPCLSWPGPYTWLLPTLPRTPKWICGEHNTVAVRITDHPIARTLCRRFGRPIVSTSANRKGRPPIRTTHQLSAEFGNQIDFILKGSVGNTSEPSSMRDATSGEWIRVG